MDFKVGDTVVYPHHGAAVIEGIEQREFKGETVDYLVLKINQGDLSVKVPAANAEKVGVRDVVGEEGLLKVFSVLREIDVEEAGNWSRRYKANQERLTSGDVNKVAEVVRDLWRRDHIVKSQKSKVARGILTLAAAGAALTLTACSAGQITQTSNQVAAVNGVEAEVGNIALRDVSIVIDDKNALAVKFTAGNVEERGENITLNSITVDGKAVSLSGSKDVLAGGSLIGDSSA